MSNLSNELEVSPRYVAERPNAGAVLLDGRMAEGHELLGAAPGMNYWAPALVRCCPRKTPTRNARPARLTSRHPRSGPIQPLVGWARGASQAVRPTTVGPALPLRPRQSQPRGRASCASLTPRSGRAVSSRRFRPETRRAGVKKPRRPHRPKRRASAKTDPALKLSSSPRS